MTWNEAYEAYDDMLDELYGRIFVGKIEFDPSRVLRVLDPVAYRTGFNDWADAEGIDTDELEGEDHR